MLLFDGDITRCHVERNFAWAAGFRRLAGDYERLASTFADYHWLAFAPLMLQSILESL